MDIAVKSKTEIMRHIIFRGKRLDNGEWIYGDLQIGDDDHIPMIGTTGQTRWVDYIQVAENTIGQLTELRDKNGIDIWEGDIFKEDDSGIVRSVFRVPGGLAFEDNPVSFGYDHRAPVYPYSSIAEMQNASWLSKYCEVVGNIHDHPDLLK